MEWHVIYADDPQAVQVSEDGRDFATATVEFDEAAKTGMLNGRKVNGMWLIDRGGEQEDVVRVYGEHLPSKIWIRHEAWRRAHGSVGTNA